MKINKIRSIDKSEDVINVLVDVEFGKDHDNRWELTDPVVSVVYNLEGGEISSYMELLDRGMNVHGFELRDEDREKISSFLSKNNITKGIT